MAADDPLLGLRDSWRGDLVTLSTLGHPTPTLYHMDTSYYSQVVRLVMEEEGVAYSSRHLDIHGELGAWYLAVHPAGQVPTLIHQGRVVVESRTIAMLVVEELSSRHLLLPLDMRQRVLAMVDLHYAEADIEKLSFGTLLTSNRVMAMVVPRKARRELKALEKMKKEHPEMKEVIENKIEMKKTQISGYEAPQELKDFALVKMVGLLDKLEVELGRSQGSFLCGGYTLADTLFTCTLARLVLSAVHPSPGWPWWASSPASWPPGPSWPPGGPPSPPGSPSQGAAGTLCRGWATREVYHNSYRIKIKCQ